MNLDRPAPPPAFAWGKEHDFSLRVMQVEELYEFAPVATSFSYFGAFLTLGVLMDTGDMRAGLFWFCLATAITMYRFIVIWGYQHRRGSAADPDLWANLMIGGNFFAGIQWGILGTFLFPAGHGYREIFTMMAITCYVGGSVTSYASVKWAHPALALPAAVPPAIYLFFVQDGVHAYAGAAALFFCFAIVYYAFKLYQHIEERFRLLIQNIALVEVAGGANARLERDKRELIYTAERNQRGKQAARTEAYMLATHIDHTPLPVIECDPQYQLLAWNLAAERVFGYRFDEAVGQNLAQLLLPEETHSKVAPFVERLFRERQPDSIEVEAVTKSGVRLTCTCHVTPVFSEQGKPLRVAIIVSLPSIKKASQFAPVVK